jgi:DNA-binding Lrp family transcriptional regulator
MAAKPLDKAISEAVVIDWRVGQMSQQDISEKHQISKGAVNKLCKGVEQDGASIVTAGIQYRQALAAHDDRIVTAVEKEVDERVKRMEWLNVQALKNVKGAMDALCENQNDYRARADTISKAKEVVVGKQPETAIQINNKMNVGWLDSAN